MSFKFWSKPISTAQEFLDGANRAISVAQGLFGGSGRSSIFADISVAHRLRRIECIQMKTQVLDRKVNPKPEQDTAPQTPQAPLKLSRAIVFGDEKVFG